MLTNIYTVFDDKAKAYLPPFFAHTDGMAIRNFSTAINNTEHQFHLNAADYTLFKIGNYDDSTAIVTPDQNHLNLGNGLEHQND